MVVCRIECRRPGGHPISRQISDGWSEICRRAPPARRVRSHRRRRRGPTSKRPGEDRVTVQTGRSTRDDSVSSIGTSGGSRISRVFVPRRDDLHAMCGARMFQDGVAGDDNGRSLESRRSRLPRREVTVQVDADDVTGARHRPSGTLAVDHCTIVHRKLRVGERPTHVALSFPARHPERSAGPASDRRPTPTP